MAELTIDPPAHAPAVPALSAPQPWPRRLVDRARRQPHASAFLQKRHGVWRSWRWAEVDEAVERRARGLRAAALVPGESVGIVSGARIEAVLAVHACQRAGLRAVLLNPNLPPGGLATQCEQASIVALVLEDQEQVDKVADVQSRLTRLRRLWVIDPKGVRGYRHVQVASMDTLDAPVSDTVGAHPGDVVLPAAGRVALFTAGVFSDARLVDVGDETLARLAGSVGFLRPVEGELWASLFGLADPLGHWFAVAAPVIAGVVAVFGEERTPSIAELRECAPTLLAAPARLLERLRRDVVVRAERSEGLRATLFRRWAGNEHPGILLQALVGRPLARSLGLAACRTIVCGGDRLTEGSAAFYRRLGAVPVGAFAVAEAGGPVAWLAAADDPGMVAAEGAIVRGDAQGVLQLQIGAHVIRTGDRVATSASTVRLLGRTEDMLSLGGGRTCAPGPIEAELAADPHVGQAVVVGGPATGLTALVELDEAALRDWARRRGLPLTTLRRLAESPEVAAVVARAVDDANRRLGPEFRISRHLILPRALDAANGELTASLAMRRTVIRNRYAHRLAALCVSAPEASR